MIPQELVGDIQPLRRPSPRLTFDDAVEVWKRHMLGESQHHIAQVFGVNQGRISEILKERRHIGSRLAALGRNSLSDGRFAAKKRAS